MDYFENGALWPDRAIRRYNATTIPKIDAPDLNDIQAAIVLLYGQAGASWFSYIEDFTASKTDVTAVGPLPDKNWRVSTLNANTRVSLGYPSAAGTEHYGEVGGLYINALVGGPATYQAVISRDSNTINVFSDFVISTRVSIKDPAQLAAGVGGFSFLAGAGFKSDRSLGELWAITNSSGADVATGIPIKSERFNDLMLVRRSGVLKYYIDEIEVYSETKLGLFALFPTITCNTVAAATYAAADPIVKVDFIRIAAARFFKGII